ncbi:MAG: discoidin domain-containing protein [Phycisphaerales bacterium]|nr:discoidin domain-containing protein [Phycisphaerales bacterium]
MPSNRSMNRFATWAVLFFVAATGFYAGAQAPGDETLPFPADPQEKTLLLRRYVPLTPYTGWSPAVDSDPGRTMPYMDVGDTYLSRANPDLNYGRSERLVLTEPQDKILIQFGRLYRWITVGSHVQDVALILKPDGTPDPETEIVVYRVTQPWRDGGGDGIKMVQTVTYNQRYSEGAELCKFARPWTAPGGDRDRLEEPSWRGKLADCWDAELGAYVLTGPGLQADVAAWLERHWQNHGWMIALATEEKPSEPLKLFASDVFEEADRPGLRVRFQERPIVRPAKPDLTVTYIERTPKYYRYNDNGQTSYLRQPFRGDMPGIMLNPDYGDDKKWPEPGELVVFIAHVKNASDVPFKGTLNYRWKINDEVVLEKSGVAGEGRRGRRAQPVQEITLGPWEEFTTRLEWHWDVDLADPRKVVVQFEIDHENLADEITKNNNALNKYVAGKTWKYWVEAGLYEHVKNHPKPWGSYAFEDYLQWHVDVWNETYFDKSRFDDFAPDGSVLRVTLDAIEIMPNGLAGGGIHRAEDRLDPRYDGEWGSRWIRDDANEAERRNYFRFVESRQIVLEPSLLHEGSHQVWGAYDIYWSAIEAAEPDQPRGKGQIREENGKFMTRGRWWHWAGLMGGCDTRPDPRYRTGTGLYSANSVGGANANARFRNGFYGDWQYDTPRRCGVKLISADGTPIRHAQVTIFQQNWSGMRDTNVVAANLDSGPYGVLTLPNQDSLHPTDATTATGHTLRKWNPWGRLDVVGQNITFCLRIDAYGQRDYQFIDVTQFNRAFWGGHTDSYDLPVVCRISPSERLDLATNVAQGAQVRASRGADTAGRVVDGNVETAWEGGRAEVGDWIEITLPAPQRVGRIDIVQDGRHGDFFQHFTITTRMVEDVAAAEPEWFGAQDPLHFNGAMGNDRDINPDRPSERWITYARAPVTAQVIRIEATAPGGTHLSEVRVFAEK